MEFRNDNTDDGCFAMTCERKYYWRGDTFIKRSLRPREYRTSPLGLHVPWMSKQSLKNEAETLKFIRAETDVPVPKLYCHFEDDGAYYLITEFIQGVCMSELPDDRKLVVQQELLQHIATLRTLRSNQLGGPTGIVVPPSRVNYHTRQNRWEMRRSTQAEYVFCHNDLSQQNVIVDPETLRIKAIIDWETAGFYPERFDSPFYRRLGPSTAMEGEHDDSRQLLRFLRAHQVAPEDDPP